MGNVMISTDYHGRPRHIALKRSAAARFQYRLTVPYSVMLRALLGTVLAMFMHWGPMSAVQAAEVLIDTYGVPHIYAQSDEDLIRAYGYVQMRAHPTLLPALYAAARGRSAEYFGDKFINQDRLTRTLGIPKRGEQWYARQSPAYKRLVDAFVAGINRYAREHSATLAGADLSIFPIRGSDVLRHLARLWTLFAGTDTECNQVGVTLDISSGSNLWALSASRSVSGAPMLLINPHLDWNAPEQRFFEAQLVAPATINFSGVTLLGLPTPVMGFDGRHGFGLTASPADICDLYALTLHGENYTLDGMLQRLEITEEILKVKQPDGTLKNETLLIRHSAHGPVFFLDNKAVAVRINGQELNPQFRALEQLWQMSRAPGIRAFNNALRLQQLPVFNVAYAQRDGTTLFALAAAIPVRSQGDFAFWSQPLPGDRSDLIWYDTHAFSDLPTVVNPASGYVQNSNASPWLATAPALDPQKFPAYFAPPELGQNFSALREQRSIKLIESRSPFSFESLVDAKFDTHIESADRVLDSLLDAAGKSDLDPNTRAAADTLRQWDRRSDSQSEGMALYALFFNEWLRKTYEFCLVPESGCINNPLATTIGKFVNGLDVYRVPWSLDDPLNTPRELARVPLALAALTTSAQSLVGRGVPLNVPWGSIARLRVDGTDRPGWGAADPAGAFAAMQYDPDSDGLLRARFGETYIAAVEFSSPLKAGVLLGYGNSSIPGSPHNGDQLELLSRKQLRDPLRTRASVLANLEQRLDLN